jgi:hypothetical protein
MARRRLDLRLLRRALRSPDRLVLLGEDGGFTLRWIGSDQRSALWDLVRDQWYGPGGTAHGTYSGYEFVNNNGGSLIYVEAWCS